MASKLVRQGMNFRYVLHIIGVGGYLIFLYVEAQAIIFFDRIEFHMNTLYFAK